MSQEPSEDGLDHGLDDALDEARRGDEQGVVTLFRAFQPGLVGYLRHRAPGMEEDLASEAWAGAAGLLPRFEGDARAFRALLFTLARRRTVDHFRKTGRAPSVVELAEADEAPDGIDLETAVISNLSTQDAIEDLVRGLSTVQADVILLRVVGDLSVDEVAEILGRTAGSVRVIQHRALQRLARRFRKVVTQ